MVSDNFSYESQPTVHTKRVFFTGSTALVKGQGLCYERDYADDTEDGHAATDSCGYRDRRVELPNSDNHLGFAGVTSRAYGAKSNGQWIEIYEPGSVCEIALVTDSTINTGIKTCVCSSGVAGYWSLAGFPGRGSAVPMETTDADIIDGDGMTGTGAIGTDGVTLTLSGGTFETDEIAAGDKVVIFAGEADGSNTTTPGIYTISSVTSETVLVLSSAATDGGTMQVTFSIIPAAQPTCLAYLMTGDESGLVEFKQPNSVGVADTAVWTTTNAGMTYICGGYTQTVDHGYATLADGPYYGSRKGYWCLGAIATQDAEVILATTGKQQTVNDGTTTVEGGPLDLVGFQFDTAGQMFFLEWWGVWVERYNTAKGVDAS